MLFHRVGRKVDVFSRRSRRDSCSLAFPELLIDRARSETRVRVIARGQFSLEYLVEDLRTSRDVEKLEFV